jgi:hypothetical protein
VARSVPRRPRWRLLAVLVGCCACPAPCAAQTATGPQLKAAYLYNFVKFTEWPGDALGPADPIALCVVNDRQVTDMLVTLVQDRTIGGHRLTVRLVKVDDATLLTCRVVFAGGLDSARAAALLGALAGKPILTVGDGEQFAHAGGIAGFFVENGALRFAINMDAAQRAGVRLSSQLLGLAKIVKDDPNGPHR